MYSTDIIVHRLFLEKVLAVLQICIPIAMFFNTYSINIGFILFELLFLALALVAGFQAFTKPWLQISTSSIFISSVISGETIAKNELKHVEMIREKALVGEVVRFIFHLNDQKMIGFQPPQEKKILTAIIDALTPYMDDSINSGAN
ncbi:hypothetical protein [Candidatus Albibeggiatoa sp. nov. NOAA]|uniref:hypothetical protein n=1 Tax=Candidatus Albibeggiatoa sp. nov. NOAA TaxID=3162724 RepID=UPI0032F89811|nr:hypothetical protein [Thiotrichaceae bacterium]